MDTLTHRRPDPPPPPPDPMGLPRITGGQPIAAIDLIRVRRSPTDDEAEARDHVLTLAHAWQRGELPRSAVRQQSTPFERFTAVRFTAPHTADFRVLMALLDELVDHEHELTGEFVYATDHGIFARSELDDASARITPIANPDGFRPGSRIVFPVTVDAAGNARYLETQQQRWAYANSPRSEAPRIGIVDRWGARNDRSTPP